MHFDVVTLFPEMFQSPLDTSIIARARAKELVSFNFANPRDMTTDRHHVVDDYPYGGGAGMVMKPEPLIATIEAVHTSGPIIILSPRGRVFNQAVAAELAAAQTVMLVCGHYEGIDERVREHIVTDEISIGDYVLTGGELAALVVIDAVVRLLPGVLANDSPLDESHASGLLEYPQYTRPADYRGWSVPDVLLNGNHAAIARWRRKEALRRTRACRPDLLACANLEASDRKLLEEIEHEEQESPPDSWR